MKTKKKIFHKNRTLFPQIYALRCTPIQIIGRDADVDHSQTIGGIEANHWGIYPPPPLFRHPCVPYRTVLPSLLTISLTLKFEITLTYKSAISIHIFSVGFSCLLPLHTKEPAQCEKSVGFLNHCVFRKSVAVVFVRIFFQYMTCHNSPRS